MTTYEVLDAIADSYTPILFFGYLIFSVLYFRGGDRTAVFKGLAGVAVAYLFMFLDNRWQVWHAFSLDYSTHSSVALALVIFHVHKRKPTSFAAIGLIISLLCYYVLEVYQEYHSVLDILSTVLVVGPCIGLVYWAITKLAPANAGARASECRS